MASIIMIIQRNMQFLSFKDKNWSGAVDEEYGNYDYLMGADIDFKNPEVVEECTKWGKVVFGDDSCRWV